MSGFSSMALPGGIPMSGAGRGMITPESLFSSSSEKAAYQKLIDTSGSGASTNLKIKKVKVEIFDFSKSDQVEAYEKLWTALLEKASRMEVVVDSRKDLVQRSDGTSYWMKYVEYVEFGDASEESEKAEKANGKDEK